MSEKNTRLYELGFVLVPTTAEPEVPAKVEALKQAIIALEGAVTNEGNPEFIDLAYTMEQTVGSKKNKYSQGYFGWVKFDLAPEALADLKKVLDGNADLVRYILVKTSAQNTVVFKKPKVEPKRDAAILDEDLVGEELPDDGIVDDQSLDHERLPSVAEDLVSGTTEDNASEVEAA